jgi:integrase
MIMTRSRLWRADSLGSRPIRQSAGRSARRFSSRLHIILSFRLISHQRGDQAWPHLSDFNSALRILPTFSHRSSKTIASTSKQGAIRPNAFAVMSRASSISGIGCVRKIWRSRMSTKQSSADSFPIICPTAPVHALFSVTDLMHAVPQPACSGQTKLPEALSGNELEQLFRSFDMACPSRRRSYAMVRCLADLGLRSSEVVRLSLDDIDWQVGTIRITLGKGRRADVLPLPGATGEAIADYLLHERPKTTCRNIFVRHVAPLGEPVGRRVVQKAVHAAYRRLGWDRTRVHILRHTLATRLVNAGTPMKQIADVLRHRSIVTSATYTRVDSSRLSAVALCWPGSVA